jgi:lambda repressor-like predicted transcriptional regulator
VSRLRNERGLPIGEQHQKAVLAQVQVDEAFELRDAGWSQQAIADKYGVARRTIRDVLSGRCWNKAGAVTTPWQARQADALTYRFSPELLGVWNTPPPP